MTAAPPGTACVCARRCPPLCSSPAADAPPADKSSLASLPPDLRVAMQRAGVGGARRLGGGAYVTEAHAVPRIAARPVSSGHGREGLHSAVVRRLAEDGGAARGVAGWDVASPALSPVPTSRGPAQSQPELPVLGAQAPVAAAVPQVRRLSSRGPPSAALRGAVLTDRHGLGSMGDPSTVRARPRTAHGGRR